eukprot:6245341-Prymnesium_polylepis.1
MEDSGGPVVSGEENQSCFVCEEDTDDTLLHDVCQCTSRSIHLECQRKLVALTPSHTECCAVCKARYRNVRVQTSRRLSRRLGAWCVPFIAISFGCLLIVSVFQLYVALTRRSRIHLTMSLCFLCFLAASSFAMFLNRSAFFRMPPLFVVQVHAVLTASSRPASASMRHSAWRRRDIVYATYQVRRAGRFDAGVNCAESQPLVATGGAGRRSL